MADDIKKSDYSDVYKEEIEKNLKSLKRFREAWLRFPCAGDRELFQFADSDFYFYRFAINRQEKNAKVLLNSILYRIMAKSGINFEIPDDRKDAPFDFVIVDNNKKQGYMFDDFYDEEGVNDILNLSGIDTAYIIRTWKSEQSRKWISRENEHYQECGIRLIAITLEDFFNTYFSKNEYDCLATYVNQYIESSREITGYKSIKFLSSMNLASQRIFEEKMLFDWQYKNYQYKIIDRNNRKIRRYLYLEKDVLSEEELNRIEDNYLKSGIFRTMVGSNEYAESFITSEWLYHSLKGKRNFDFTSVISGYLKSIEQLLYQIVMINIENNCKISINSESEIREEARKNNILAYKNEKGIWKPTTIPNPRERGKGGYIYIDLTLTQAKYMDSSIGTFEYFLRYNPHIFIDNRLSKTIADMVCCFRQECRNGFFHTHNLNDWDIVETTRANAIYLYYLILGTCVIPKDKKSELRIQEGDRFDELCKKIREFRQVNPEFIFEYYDGRRINLIYDFLYSPIEYTDDGIEHNVSLLFYEVEEHTMKEYEKLDKEIKEDQKIYLTRDNLPYKIYGVHRDRHLEQISF